MLNPASGERAGVGYYTFHLVDALARLDRRHEYVLYFDHRMPRDIAGFFRGRRVTLRWLPWSRYGKYMPFAYSHLLISAAIARDRLDVFHATANVMPLAYRGRSVLTVHDLAIYAHPEWFPRQPIATRLLVPRSIAKADRIIAVSEATKRDIIKQFGVRADRLSVVPEAAETSLLKLKDRTINVRATYHLPDRYVLYVGTLEPRKNLAMLIRAWQQYRARPVRGVRAELVLAGGLGYRSSETLELIRRAGPASGIRYLGYVPHNHKLRLMKSASAFVFPTLYEGFGLPVLEALQLGVPVIASNVASIPEVVGSAANLLRPNDIGGWAEAIRRAVAHGASLERRAKLGPLQAKKFSWARTARETLAVYRQAAGA